MAINKSQLDDIIVGEFGEHPFSQFISFSNVKSILCDFLGFSQAFPYVQAGSQKANIFRAMNSEQAVTREIEATALMGAFITWDEMGGNKSLLNTNTIDLVEMLNTKQHIHSHLLLHDLNTILRLNLQPSFSKSTIEYLSTLCSHFENEQILVRCAAMLSFEAHATPMINSLWTSISSIYSIEKEELHYFNLHVGGENSAEKQHIDMMLNLVQDILPKAKEEVFLEQFIEQYKFHVSWCKSIADI